MARTFTVGRVTSRPRRASALAAAAAAALVVVAGCGGASPTLDQVKAEPVLDVPSGATVLLRINVKPRSSAIGRDGRDGGAEIVYASPDRVTAVADRLASAWSSAYGLKRVDNSADGTVVGSELRGTDAKTGAVIQIVVTSGKPYTLLGGPDDLARPPVGSRSYTSVAVLSQQR